MSKSGDKKNLLAEATRRVRHAAKPRVQEIRKNLTERKWIPDWMRREGIDTAWLENTRQRLTQWLAPRALGEVTLILDGPGYGAPQGLVALAMLGAHRVTGMAQVHAFSASCLQVLFQLAHASGEFIVPEWDASRWHRENQWRHAVRPGATLLRGLSNRLRRSASALFSDHLPEAAMSYSVAESFVSRPISSLPPTLKFWVYNRTRGIFEAMGAGTRFEHLRIGDMVHACTSVPGLYSPFLFEGEELVDALWGKDIRPLYKMLRQEAKHVIFGHMQRDGEFENTLFVKLHPDTHAYRRIGLDFAYFVLGMDNRDIGDAIRLGFFEIAPISERELRAQRRTSADAVAPTLLPPA